MRVTLISTKESWEPRQRGLDRVETLDGKRDCIRLRGCRRTFVTSSSVRVSSKVVYSKQYNVANRTLKSTYINYDIDESKVTHVVQDVRNNLSIKLTKRVL